MRSKRFLLTGALLAITACAIVVAGASDSPWGGGSAEARPAMLTAGVFTPIGGDGGATAPAAPALAAGPSQISFQGRLTNPGTGNAIGDGTYTIKFSVFDTEATGTGTELWTETAPVSVEGGLFSVQLGSIDNFPTDLFSDNPRFLEVQVDTDLAMTPRLAFLSVPYAFHADIADLASDAADVNCTGCVHSSDVEFTYAGSATQGGPAADVACVDCIAANEAQFNYAGSTSEGGPATDVACVAPCIVSAEIVDGSVFSQDIADSTIASADILNGTVASTDIADGTVASADIADGTIASVDIADGAITAADVSFPYAGSTSAGGPASDVACANCIVSSEISDGQVFSGDIADSGVASVDILNGTISSIDIADGTIAGADVLDGSLSAADVADSQLLDGLNSTQFLRSDTGGTVSNSVNFANGIVTVGTSTGLSYDNAGADWGLRLNNNGGEGNQYIYFFEDGSATGESLNWSDVNDRFGVTDDLEVGELYHTGNTLRLNSDGPDGTHGIYFYEGFSTAEQFLWDDTNHRFYFSDDVDATGNVTLGGNEVRINSDGPDADSYIYFYDNGSPTGQFIRWDELQNQFIVSNDLYVGGSASVYGLDVIIDPITVNTLGAAGATAVCRNASNQLSTCSSSARYKDAISPLAFNSEDVLALRPVQFNWKDSGEPGVGLVAEEVADILPEVVTYNDAGDVEGVQYDKLTVYLLELLKEHETELAELRAASDSASSTGPAASGNLGASQLVFLLAAAVSAAAIVSAGTTLAVTQVGRKGVQP